MRAGRDRQLMLHQNNNKVDWIDGASGVGELTTLISGESSFHFRESFTCVHCWLGGNAFQSLRNPGTVIQRHASETRNPLLWSTASATPNLNISIAVHCSFIQSLENKLLAAVGNLLLNVQHTSNSNLLQLKAILRCSKHRRNIPRLFSCKSH